MIRKQEDNVKKRKQDIKEKDLCMRRIFTEVFVKIRQKSQRYIA